MPFVKFGGLKFLEAAHVKDFVAAVRLLDNRLDEVAWYRLLRLHDGIGPARARALLEVLVRPGDQPADTTTCRAPPTAVARPRPRRAGDARVALAATLDGLAAARGQRRIGDRAGGLPGPAPAAAHGPLSGQRGPARRPGPAGRRPPASAPDLAAFVAELTLDPPASTGDLAGPPHLDDDYLVLSTVHSAKGLEWPVVHVIAMVDGAFPVGHGA